MALSHQVDAVIATNTTLGRENLQSPHQSQAGGLSGRPLFDRSTRVLAQMATHLEGKIPLIGVGGIGSGQDAYDKICAGASAVQLYTALVYHGLSLITEIAKNLDTLLQQDGFENVSEAIASKRQDWL